MTVATDTCVATYAGNGQQTEFPFDFKIFEETDLKLVIRAANGEETVPDEGEYEVSGAGDPNGGSVAYPLSGAPVPQGATITLYRELPFTQDLELVENDPFPASLIERQFDRSVMRDQQILDRLERSLAYSVSTPEDERLTPLEYVEELCSTRDRATDQAALAKTEHDLAREAATRAASDAERAFARADLAAAAALDVEGMAVWWSVLSVAAVPDGGSAFTAPGNLEFLFTPGRAVRLTPPGGSAPTTGHVVRAMYNGLSATTVDVTCPVPSAIAGVEYGQDVANAPRPAPSAMVPEVAGPSSGNEQDTREFKVLRADGSEYSGDVRLFLQALRSGDNADISADFTLAMPNASTLRLTLPAVSADLAATLRFRASEGVLGYSDWTGPMEFLVRHVPLTADNGAVLEAEAEDWPFQESGAATSKTVEQGSGEVDWTKLSATMVHDSTGSALSVSSYSGGTLVCTHEASGLSGPWAFKPVGSDLCAIVEDDPTETTAPGEDGQIALTADMVSGDGVNAAYLVDNSTGTNGIGGSISAGAVCAIDLGGVPCQLATWRFTYDGAGSGHTFAIEYSDDGTNWTAAISSWTANSAESTYIAETEIPASGSHRYWRSRCLTTLNTYNIAELDVWASASESIYTWTGRTESSVEKVYQLPKLCLATGGEGELLVPETPLEIVAHSGTALTVKYPASRTGLFGGGTERQHAGITLDGSISATVAEAGAESDVDGGANRQVALTLAADPGVTPSSASKDSCFPASPETPLSCVRSNLFIYNATTTAYQERTTRTASAGADLVVDTSFSLQAGAAVTHLGLFQSSEEGEFSGALHIVRDNGTTVTSVACKAIYHPGDETLRYYELSTPYIVPNTGTYRIGTHTVTNSVTCCDGSRLYVGLLETFVVGDTSDPGATYGEVSPTVAYKALDHTIHDRLTTATAERPLDDPARSVAMRIERPQASDDQYHDATIHLWKGEE